MDENDDDGVGLDAQIRNAKDDAAWGFVLLNGVTRREKRTEES